jgi:hypothetical protein
MAPTIAGSIKATSSGATGPTTASFTPSANSILVATFVGSNENQLLGTVSGGGLTWTKRAEQTPSGTNCTVALWTATAPSSPSSMTVTGAAGTGTGLRFLSVSWWDAAKLATTPATNVALGSTTCSSTITTAANDSVVVWVVGDWNAVTGARTYRSSATEIQFNQTTSEYCAYNASQTATTAGSQTYGMTAPSSQKATMVAIELQAGTTIVASTETGTGAETLAVLRDSLLTDTATGADVLAVAPAVAVTDTATGADVLAVTQIRAVTDAGSGVESLHVDDIVYKSVDDVGTGAEVLTPEIPVLKSVSDAGAGVDSLHIDPVANCVDAGVGTEVVGIARTSSTTDVGSGAESLSALRMSSVGDAGTGTSATSISGQHSVSDSGVGGDAIAILRISTVADSGIGSDTLLPGPQIFEHGLGEEVIDLVVIPFTQVLPLRQGPVYDVVIVARIPQVSGPPAFIEIDPIEWKSLTYANTLSQPQELSASCQISSLTESVLQRLRNLAELATEIWLSRNGKVVFAGPVMGYQTSGEDLTITAKGLLAYLRMMYVTSDLVFQAKDQATIVKSMIDQWQDLSYGNFGLDTSSITATGVTRNATYLSTELHNIGQRVEDLGVQASGFDAEIDPATRKISLWSPFRGVDRSTGEDAIVIDERNITSGDIVSSVAIGDIATDSFVTGTSQGQSAPLYSTRFNAELRAKFGRAGISQTYSDISDQPTLDNYAQALVDARKTSLLIPGPKTRVTPDADLASYGVGDTIAYQLGGVLAVSGSFRIRKQTITARSTGQEDVDLEFV